MPITTNDPSVTTEGAVVAVPAITGDATNGPKVPKTRRPRTSRKDIDQKAPASMTNEEKINYIKQLRAERDTLFAKCDQLDMLCKRFAEQAKNADNAYQMLRKEATERENYLRNLMKMAYESAVRMEMLRL